MNKRQLYESIMRNVSHEVKKALNEALLIPSSADDIEIQYYTAKQIKNKTDELIRDAGLINLSAIEVRENKKNGGVYYLEIEDPDMLNLKERINDKKMFKLWKEKYNEIGFQLLTKKYAFYDMNDLRDIALQLSETFSDLIFFIAQDYCEKGRVGCNVQGEYVEAYINGYEISELAY